MGKKEILWSVPVAEVRQITPTIFEKRFSYYGIAFPSLCCICAEAPATVAHEIKSEPFAGKGTFTMKAPWCQKCADDYTALQNEYNEKQLKPIPGKWLGRIFLFGIAWWLIFGFIQPGILPAIGGTIWLGCIAIYIIEHIIKYLQYKRRFENYEGAIKIKGAVTKGIIHRQKVLLVSFKNEKYSEEFGKANSNASLLYPRKKQ